MEKIKNEKRKIIFSGIQPTGGIHIGNLFGAITNWVKMQDEYECFYCIVDLHAITIRQTPAELRKNSLDLAAMLIACGLDPEKCVLFIQSHVPHHAQLAWVLNCFTPVGELGRMTQFKDKSSKHPDNINVGLFGYPVLQAADILLYQTDMVPVGEDQKQHLELSRNIAERFNYYYPGTFAVPEPYIPPVGARIMSLQEPGRKMSKSDENEKATVFLTDSDNEIRNKIKRAVTDSGSSIKYSAEKPGLSNLISLFNSSSGIPITEIENMFAGKGYGEFKEAVAESMVKYINPIRTLYEKIRSDNMYLSSILKKNAEIAINRAAWTLRKVYKKIGFVDA